MGVLTRVLTVRSVTLVAFETMLIVAGDRVCGVRPFRRACARIRLSPGRALQVLLVAVVLQGCLYYADLYDVRMLADRRELFVRLVQALARRRRSCWPALYYWLPALVIGRGVFVDRRAAPRHR